LPELRIASFENELVLYFETPEPRISAYALASTLVALSDAAKAAGRTLNSTVDFEIVVEALGSGSFRARITAIARESGLFVGKQIIVPLLIGVLGAYVYDHTLNRKEPVQVQVTTDEVIITKGDDRIIVPREIHEKTQEVAKNPTFVRSMNRMLNSVTLDDRVTGFGLATSMKEPPEVILPRELLGGFDEGLLDGEEKKRIIEEDADLYIVKAIMERSNRKWEFRWHGVSITAPIKDPKFYDDFAGHNFTIAPGDDFQARLAIHQKRDDISGIYANTGYEVLHVYRHVSRPKAKTASML